MRKTTLSKTISLDSNSLNHQSFAEAKEPQAEKRSTSNDVYRYSYNLGKNRVAKMERAASVGGNLIHPMMEEGGFVKNRFGRRGITRSVSMGAHTGIIANNEPTNDAIRHIASPFESDLHVRLGNSSLDEKTHSTGKERENLLQSENHASVKEVSEKPTPAAETSEKKNIEEEKVLPDSLIKKSRGLWDSVPDLRAPGNSRVEPLQAVRLEGFSSFLNHIDSDHEPQTRSIMKLRRAARRLGVSLSSEELYHKQRRNGVCTEIDDAAENRKLLRVLNKRF